MTLFSSKGKVAAKLLGGGSRFILFLLGGGGKDEEWRVVSIVVFIMAPYQEEDVKMRFE